MNYDPEYNHERFNPPSEDKLNKLSLSELEVEDMGKRVLKCPVCNFKIQTVFMDVTGHIEIRCPKCKFQGVINLSYFRTQKRYSDYYCSCYHNISGYR